MKGVEEDGMRARSFRYEDYNTRRVFLRSYPLHWGAESGVEQSIKAEAEAEAEAEAAAAAAAAKSSKEEPAKITNRTKVKKPIWKMILAVVQWGEARILVFRRFKHKITVYVVNCVPRNFKVPTALISIK